MNGALGWFQGTASRVLDIFGTAIEGKNQAEIARTQAQAKTKQATEVRKLLAEQSKYLAFAAVAAAVAIVYLVSKRRGR